MRMMHLHCATRQVNQQRSRAGTYMFSRLYSGRVIQRNSGSGPEWMEFLHYVGHPVGGHGFGELTWHTDMCYLSQVPPPLWIITILGTGATLMPHSRSPCLSLKFI
jgi:hypothetical protein